MVDSTVAALQTGRKVASTVRSVTSKSFDFHVELQSCASVEEVVTDHLRNTTANLVEDPLDGWCDSKFMIALADLLWLGIRIVSYIYVIKHPAAGFCKERSVAQ